MQSTTGCKINVAQPNPGADFEREIGLVGSRGAIEQAKRAIMDKVHAVVGPNVFTTSRLLTHCRKRKIAQEAAGEEALVMIHIKIDILSLNSNNLFLKILVLFHKHNRIVTLIRMQRMVATRLEFVTSLTFDRD